jgi:hypothetical protein
MQHYDKHPRKLKTKILLKLHLSNYVVTVRNVNHDPVPAQVGYRVRMRPVTLPECHLCQSCHLAIHVAVE